MISYFNTEKAKQMLNLPDKLFPVCMLYVGYSADDFTPNPAVSGKRLPLSKTVSYNEYSEE